MKIILLSLFSFIAFAQKKQVKGYVYYGEYENIFSGHKGGNEVRGTLLFDKNQSCYYTGKDSLNQAYQKEIDLSDTKETKNEPIEIDDRVIYSSGYSDDLDHINYAVETKNDSVYSVYEYGSDKYGNYHYSKEPKAKIKWKLEKDTKKIGDFTCSKATCHFRGRDYIAWYNPSIPVPYGPWKFQGLPGLIVEVYTPNQEIYFYAKKIIYPLEVDIPLQRINKPKDEKWIISINGILKRQDDLLQESYDQAILIFSSMPNPPANYKVIKSESKVLFKEYEEE